MACGLTDEDGGTAAEQMIRWSRTNNQCQEDWAEGEECREAVCVNANCDREAWKR